jgi:hypothetical protein
MILTDYYKLERLPETRSKTRFDCTTSTQHYNDFEVLRNKKHELFMYYGDVPENFKGSVKRKADKALTKTKNISSVFVPNINRLYAFGDIINTSDALLMVFNENYTKIEIFIARGQLNNVKGLYNLLTDGELNEEIEILKSRAVTETVTQMNI